MSLERDINKSYNPVINTSDAHEFTRLLYFPMKPLTDDYLKHQCVLDENGEVKRDLNNNVTWRRDNRFEENIEVFISQQPINRAGCFFYSLFYTFAI